MWEESSEISWWAHIYVAGDMLAAEAVCREHCLKGLCVTVEPVKYVHGRGAEDGVRVGMIQYPKFPEHEETLMVKAEMLGRDIAEACFQWSYSIVTPAQVHYYSREGKM